MSEHGKVSERFLRGEAAFPLKNCYEIGTVLKMLSNGSECLQADAKDINPPLRYFTFECHKNQPKL